MRSLLLSGRSGLLLAVLEDVAGLVDLVNEVLLVGEQLLVVDVGLIEDHTGDGRSLVLAEGVQDGRVDAVTDEVLTSLSVLQALELRSVNHGHDELATLRLLHLLLLRSRRHAALVLLLRLLHLHLLRVLLLMVLVVVVAAALALVHAATAVVLTTAASATAVAATMVLVVAAATTLSIATVMATHLLLRSLAVLAHLLVATAGEVAALHHTRAAGTTHEARLGPILKFEILLTLCFQFFATKMQQSVLASRKIALRHADK